MGFARNGVIVDEPMTDILRDIIEALKAIATALQEIEQRVGRLEHGR